MPIYASTLVAVCEGKRGSTVQMVSTSNGTLTAGPCMDRCLPDGNATIFIKGTRKDINLNSSKFRLESSGGIGLNCKPLALACNGMFTSAQCPVTRITHPLFAIGANVVMFRTKHLF